MFTFAKKQQQDTVKHRRELGVSKQCEIVKTTMFHSYSVSYEINNIH